MKGFIKKNKNQKKSLVQEIDNEMRVFIEKMVRVLLS